MKQAKRFLSVLLSLCLVLGMIPSTVFAASSNLPFTDVNATNWYYDAVQYAYEKGMMNGTSTTTFSPNDTTTRGMIVTILHRMEGTPAAVGTAFTDVPASQWYSDAISWASANGIVSGYGNGTFGPGDPITREQMAAILNRYATYKGYDTGTASSISGFSDASQVSSYAVEPMGWAVGNGLISGTGNNTLAPKGNATRAQVATILMRFCENIANKAPDTTVDKTYTVMFDLNYGSNTQYDMKIVKEGETVSKPSNPSRSGYSFSGWYVEKSGGKQFDFKTGITSDLTLYAHWSSNSSSGGDGGSYIPPATNYSVTFETNGGSSVVSQIVREGMTATEPDAPIKEGSTFVGWYTDVALTAVYDFSTPVTSNIILYAKWSENNTTPPPDTYHTVTFDSNGGTPVPSQSVIAGGHAVQPADPTKTGYVFNGWYTDSALTMLYDFSTSVTEDITLYGNWIVVDVTITIDTHDNQYENTDVRRTFTVTVASANAIVTEVAYTLEGSAKTESGTLGTNVGTFSADVLLEDGENTFTVCVSTEDGATVSKYAVVQYVSGHIYDENWTFEEYAENGIILVPVYESSNISPSFYVMTNVVRLYFTSTSTTEEREAFIAEHSDLFKAKVGEKSALRMMQATLQTPLTEKESLTIDEYYDEIYDVVARYADLSPIVTEVVAEEYYPNMGMEYVSSDRWGNNSNNDWWLRYIDADDAWEYDNYYNSDFLTNMTLGIVDNGFSRHIDLDGRISSFVTDEDSPNLALDHGTHVAGIMAAIADNGEGLAGTLHNNSNLVVADIFPGSGGVSSSAILSGLVNTVEAGAKVVNFSLGSSNSVAEGSTSRNPRGDRRVSDASRQIGILLEDGFDFIVVQSAGNGDENYHGVNYWNNGTFCAINQDNCYETNDPTVENPVNKNDIIGRIIIVANLQSDGTLNESSNGITSNDSGDLNIVAAPGTNIYSTIHTQEYASWDGTSMAAPIVSSVCGLVWSVNRLLKGNTVVEMVMNNTVGTAQTSSGTTHTSGGMGIVNALDAVEATIESLPTYKTTVVDATTGSGISAKIVIKNSAGELVGNSTGTYYSNSDGSFTLPKLPTGRYTLTVSADGYADNLINCSIGVGAAYNASGAFSPITVTIADIPLSPGMDDDYYRIILRWGETPRDLDSHLVATTDDGAAIHVYYSNKNPSPYYANLDHDDTTSYGPETITITNFENLSNVTYAVHDYTNRSSSSSTAMSTSGAYVLVYKGNTLLQRFDIPVNREGTEWDVFTFDASGNIIPINQMKYCSNPSNVLANDSTVSMMSLWDMTVELKDYEIFEELD